MSRATNLYRCFDQGGSLLYVGISYTAIRRLGEHQGVSWGREVKTLTVETFSSRREALIAETKAICDEKPRFNIIGLLKPPRSPPSLPSPLKRSKAKLAKQISIRLPRDIDGWLQEYATADQRSVAFVITAIVRDIMKRDAQSVKRRKTSLPASK